MQGIVIQGQTTYFKEVADNWSGWPNVVWSTWTNEPQSNIDYIKSKGIEVVQSIPPSIPGDMNINYQCASTFRGLNHLHRKGCISALKIRSDHTVSDRKTLLEILWGRNMAFLAISNAPKRMDLTYELDGLHFGHDYPSDNLIYGNINEMMIMFNFQVDKNYNVPPESMICYNYMTAKGLKFELTYDYFIRNNMSFFVGECVVKGIKINWLKKNLEMISFYNNEYFRY